jgi:hypothetical protein
MEWLYVVVAALIIWGLCGAVMGLGRRLIGLDATLLLHLIMAPVFSFCVTLILDRFAPTPQPLSRAIVITAIVIVLDAAVVAPFIEKSYAMFGSLIGTWIPFVLIFLASWAAGLV